MSTVRRVQYKSHVRRTAMSGGEYTSSIAHDNEEEDLQTSAQHAERSYML